MVCQGTQAQPHRLQLQTVPVPFSVDSRGETVLRGCGPFLVLEEGFKPCVLHVPVSTPESWDYRRAPHHICLPGFFQIFVF